MADERTQEQRDADEQLEAALTRCGQAYGMITEGRALGDWIAFIEITSFDPALANTTRYGTLLPGGDGIPWHRILGLWEQGKIELTNQEGTDRDE